MVREYDVISSGSVEVAANLACLFFGTVRTRVRFGKEVELPILWAIEP